ncbi:MAG: cobalt ECF transporter T component CbiQ [Lentisphaerae bacterium]|nr:cobalt ECF transporter T component CbiQ [Lentisphaerota bacterium]
MKHTFTLFSDYFALRNNWLTRFDPRLKITAVLALILSVVFSNQVFLPLLVLSVCLGCMLSIKIPIRTLLLRFVPVAGVLVVLVGLRSFLVGTTPLYTVSILGRDLSLTSEGVGEGVLISSRVAGALSAVMLSSFITPAPQLYSTLLWFRAPRIWVEIAAMVYRYVFVILERARGAILSQRARLGYVGTMRSLNSIGILAGTVFMRAFEQAEGTHRAMLARGYTGTMPTGKLGALGAPRLAALVVICGVIAGGYFMLERFAG